MLLYIVFIISNFFFAFCGSGLAFDKSVNNLSFRFGASKYEEVIVNIKEN